MTVCLRCKRVEDNHSLIELDGWEIFPLHRDALHFGHIHAIECENSVMIPDNQMDNDRFENSTFMYLRINAESSYHLTGLCPRCKLTSDQIRNMGD